MNIQNYMTMETLLSFLVVGAMALIYISFRLTGRLHNNNSQSEFIEEAPILTRPNSGQMWYTRTGQWQPFINEAEEPVKILEYRTNEFDEWVRFEKGDTIKIETLNDFFSTYMPDEFSDLVKPSDETFANSKEELMDLVIEFEEEAPQPSMPSKNIVNIDGKDYVLAPVQ